MNNQDLDKYDQALFDFFESNTPIVSDDILMELHSRYPCDTNDKEIVAFRGLLFDTKQQTDNFYSSIVNGFESPLPSSLSVNKKTAEEFSRTQKTYNDMSLAKASMTHMRNGETVSGYEGVLIELLIKPSDCIDLSKAGFTSESELLLLPNREAKVLSINKKIPLSRQFSENITSIKEVMERDDFDSSPEFTFIMHNLVNSLPENDILSIVQAIEEKTNKHHQALLSRDKSHPLSLPHESGVITIEKSDKDHPVTTFIFDNTLLRESHSHTWSPAKRNYKDVIILSCDTLPSSDLIDFNLEHDLLNSNQVDKLKSKANEVSMAILSASATGMLSATELDVNLREFLTQYSDEFTLSLVASAISPDFATEYNNINSVDNTKKVTSKKALNQATDEVSETDLNLLIKSDH